MVVVLLVIDQIIKVYIKTHFCLGESVRAVSYTHLIPSFFNSGVNSTSSATVRLPSLDTSHPGIEEGGYGS